MLDSDALQVSDSVFSAVHHPTHMYRQGGLGTSHRVAYDEAQLVEDFLNPDVDYQFVCVLGHSGTGKSHLIRWMRSQIPAGDEAKRKVILVPRAGTNLRGVIEAILSGFEGEVFDAFRQKLNAASNPISVEQGRVQLLDRLAEAIEFSDGSEIEMLAKGQPPRVAQSIRHSQKFAPNFLRDSHLRQHWLRAGGVIARMYSAQFSEENNIERLEEERQFRIDDIPLNLADYQEAAQEVQGFYRQVRANTELQQALVLLMNHFRDTAIQGLLNISGDDLIRIMREVRRTLAQQGWELVLLIEDIARWQGVERQLLEALLVRPREDEGRLCGLRTALGCTNGYFETLPDTIRTRFTFRVDLNLETGQFTPSDEVIPFAVRYLNAARVGTQELENWHQNGDGEEDLPNRCDGCEYRTDCHAAFGAIRGIGLYPFNETALRQMYERTEADGFNPRFLLHDVLDRILVGYVDDVQEGAFPSPALHAAFGGLSRRWSADAQRRIERAAPREAGRHFALLDLWSRENRPIKLSDGIHEAFDLPPVSEEEEASEQEREHSEGAPTQPQEDRGKPAPHQDLIEALDAWSRGEPMQQDVANTLRKGLFPAVKARIDWDSERLLASVLTTMSTGREPFQRRSLNFADQTTSEASTEVSLTLPLPNKQDRVQVALALQGMVLYRHFGHWSFEQGAERYREYARLVEDMAEAAVQQLRKPAGATSTWSPGVAAAELLMLGARLHGHPISSRTSAEDRLDAFFAPLELVPTGETSAEWSTLVNSFAKEQDKLRDVLEGYLLCAKGGYRSTKFLDTAQFSDLLTRTNVLPRTTLPQGLPNRLQALEQLQRKTREALDPALRAEQERWKEWLVIVEQHIHPEESLADVRQAVNEARRDLDAEGLIRLTSTEHQQLQSLSRGLRENEFIQLRALAAKIRAAGIGSDVEKSTLARDIGHANTLRMAADRIRRYLELSSKMLVESMAHIDQQMNNLGGGASTNAILEELEDTIQILDDHLSQANAPSNSEASEREIVL